MKFIKYSVHTGKENMKIDSDFLDNAIQNQSKEPVFRLYGWSPRCVSIGRNQKDNFLPDDIDSVRRLTGGRALLHDDEVTYSCITPIDIIPNGSNVTESYKYISSILIDFFKTLGIKLDFGENKKISTHFDYCMLLSTGADVCYKGNKIIGSAQFRKDGYILQHGSILFGYDKEFLEKLFKEEVKGITTVKEILPNLSKDEFIKKLEQFVSQI
ncbi:lipoate--protein ligase family protein [bacterium]|nr:lipoate--protein ligase family protein [bacterium]